jgi:hypothetical protein
MGTGHSVQNERQVHVEIGEASGATPRMATTRPCRGSTQQQETQPVKSVSQAMLGTTKTGKPRQCIQWSEGTDTFIVGQYHTITKLETMKIGYRRKLHDRIMKEYTEMKISEQRIAEQRRAIVTKNLLSKPWFEEIKAQVAETLKATHVDTDEETTNHINAN